ncbi:hypothetical protein AAE478_005911 [Parahypoxylon ruwenzoriense]
MSAGSEAELIRLMTAYDNSDEPRPSFNNPSTVYGLVISFMTVSYICVALRLYTRVKLRCLGWDDLFVVLFRNGFGEHMLTIGYDNIVEFQKASHLNFLPSSTLPPSLIKPPQKFYVCLATYTISTTLMKLCLLSQYLRIFEAESSRRARLLCWVGLAVSALWGAAFSFCALFPCFPVSGFWDWLAPARCYGFGSKAPSEIAGAFAGHTGSNVVLDAVVLAIPVPLYFRKSTAWKQRVGIGLLLLLGLTVNLLGLWRLHTIVEHKAGTYPVLDPTWYAPTSIVLAALEVDLASICASIPTFWPALARFGLLGTIFVTQEVHITHQHRRLSSDCDEQGGQHYELQQRGRADSASTGTNSMTRGAFKAALLEKHYRDDFVLSSVIPLGMHDRELAVESQVKSDGQRGFERECERLRLTMVESNGNSNNTEKAKSQRLGSR